MSGRIIWSGFDNVEQIKRQREVYKVLREQLGAEAAQVSIILAYSTREREIMHEDDQAANRLMANRGGVTWES